MFLLNPKYYIPLCEKLAERNKDDLLRIWSYSRVDTVKRPEILNLVRKAGIKWLALGIESGDKSIRLEVSKGKFEDVDVKKVISKVQTMLTSTLWQIIFMDTWRYRGNHIKNIRIKFGSLYNWLEHLCSNGTTWKSII